MHYSHFSSSTPQVAFWNPVTQILRRSCVASLPTWPFMLVSSCIYPSLTSGVRTTRGGAWELTYTTWIGTDSNSSNDMDLDSSVEKTPISIHYFPLQCCCMTSTPGKEDVRSGVRKHCPGYSLFDTLHKSTCDSAILSLLQRCCLGNVDKYPRSHCNAVLYMTIRLNVIMMTKSYYKFLVK